MKEIEINLPNWVTRFFGKHKIREEVKQLAFNLENYPEDWTVDAQRATLCHDETRVALWIISGWKFLDFWPKKEAFTKKEQKYLWKPIDKIINRKGASLTVQSSDFAKLMKQIKEAQWERDQ